MYLSPFSLFCLFTLLEFADHLQFQQTECDTHKNQVECQLHHLTTILNIFLQHFVDTPLVQILYTVVYSNSFLKFILSSFLKCLFFLVFHFSFLLGISLQVFLPWYPVYLFFFPPISWSWTILKTMLKNVFHVISKFLWFPNTEVRDLLLGTRWPSFSTLTWLGTCT